MEWGKDREVLPITTFGGERLALAIEFVNVIVRKSAVERCFPGGLDGFARQDLANLTEDEHLVRVGSKNRRFARIRVVV